MASLVSVSELAVWCRQDIDSGDQFALTVLEAASLLVRDAAGHPEWTAATAPARAKLICALVAKRTYTNPDQEIATSVGPISSRVLDEAAAGMKLTEQEITELAAIGAETPGGTAKKAGLWAYSTVAKADQPVMYLYTEPGSDWPIPYLDTALDGYAAPDDMVGRK
jgi:hypothetical protein